MPDDFHPVPDGCGKGRVPGVLRRACSTLAGSVGVTAGEHIPGETFARAQGPAFGPPLVLLPGDSENSLAWIPVIEALSADHRTYAVNHIFDIGRSVYTRPMQSPDDFVQWLEELFTALELDSLSLIGHSYGGWQASLYALTHPERLDKLVLLAPASTVLRPPLGLILRAMLYYFIPTRFVTKRYLYWYAPDAVRRTDTREIIHEMIDEDLLARRCFNRSRFIAPTVLTDEDWQNLQVRTLFLVGENDVTYSAHKAVRRLNRVAPHVETMICPEADHHLALVQPEWVSNNALEFLQTPRSRSLRAWSSVAVPTCGVGEGRNRGQPRASRKATADTHRRLQVPRHGARLRCRRSAPIKQHSSLSDP